jgi:hypothetical protein
MDLSKILMVHNYSSWGGNLATVLALSAGLRELGFSVEMAFPRSEAYVTRFTDAGFAVHGFEVRSKFDLGASLASCTATPAAPTWSPDTPRCLRARKARLLITAR